MQGRQRENNMIKKIDLGKTPYSELHHLFRLESHEALERKKARLFPKGNSESETSTVSIFLASLAAVKEYREDLLQAIGVNKVTNQNVQLHVFTELFDSKKENRPDGLIILTSGKHSPLIEWACFVEAKVKKEEVQKRQIDKYIDFARDIGINDIVTISNQLVTTPNDSPVQTDKRSFNLYHWSWAYIKVMALKLIRADKIKDEDHVFILSELRRYLDTHKCVFNFESMGKEWKDASHKVHLLESGQKIDANTLESVTTAYSQEEKDVSLQLTDRSGILVELEAKKDRKEAISGMLLNNRVVTSSFYLNGDRKQRFSVDVDFIRLSATCYTEVTINQGQAQGQTTKLLKMLEGSAGYTDNIFIKGLYLRNKCVDENISLQQLIEERNRNEQYSIINKEYGKAFKCFQVMTFDRIGAKFNNPKQFIIKLEDIAFRFLNQVAINITN